MALLFPKYDYHLSGQLTLGIKTWCDGARCNWSDGKKQRLEHCLNAFVAGLIQAAVRKQAHDLAWERQRQLWEEERRQREEQERLRREEESKFQALEQAVANWHRANQIRAYADAVRQTATECKSAIDEESELGRWLAWAISQADRIDPLQASQ